MNYAVSMTSREEIEVHRFSWPVSIGVPLLAIFLQVFVSKWLSFIKVFDLPLLVTIYFGLSRRNPSTGLLLAMVIGLSQDALSGPTVPLGFYGIAKTIVGYLASSIGARLDTEHPAARFALIMAFFVVQQATLAVIRRLLLAGEPEAWLNAHLAIGAGVNALLGTLLFLALDRLRRSS